MRIIQLLVLVIAIVLVIYLLRGRSSHAGRAWKKIGLVILFVATGVTVFFPWVTDYVAHKIGVQSGINLLIYGLSMTFLLFILNAYLYEQENRDVITRLARQIAINEAKERYERSKK